MRFPNFDDIPYLMTNGEPADGKFNFFTFQYVELDYVIRRLYYRMMLYKQ